jgi:flagellar biosynthesis/type III secretory pathway protein FliH
MIVRDVVFAIEPRSLRPLVRISSDLPEGQRRAPKEEARSGTRAPLREASPPAAPKPTLEVEAAGTWLAAQSMDLRVALAQQLAPEIVVAQERGHAQGVEAGRAEALRDAAARTQSSLAALARLSAAAEETFNREAGQLAGLCTDIVAAAFVKLAGEQLMSREACLGAVLEVLKRVKDERELTIRVSEQDLPALREQEPQLRAVLGSRSWSLIADPRVSAGGCLVESRVGTLDGRFEVQLLELCETLRAAKTARWEGE